MIETVDTPPPAGARRVICLVEAVVSHFSIFPSVPALRMPLLHVSRQMRELFVCRQSICLNAADFFECSVRVRPSIQFRHHALIECTVLERQPYIRRIRAHALVIFRLWCIARSPSDYRRHRRTHNRQFLDSEISCLLHWQAFA